MEDYLIEFILPSQFYRVIPYGNLYFSTQFNNKYPRRTARMKKNWMGFVTFVTVTVLLVWQITSPTRPRTCLAKAKDFGSRPRPRTTTLPNILQKYTDLLLKICYYAYTLSYMLNGRLHSIHCYRKQQTMSRQLQDKDGSQETDVIAAAAVTG